MDANGLVRGAPDPLGATPEELVPEDPPPQAVSHCAAEILPAVSSMFLRNTRRDKPCRSIALSSL